MNKLDEQSRTKVGVAVMVALLLTIVALLVASVAIRKEDKVTCDQQKAELQIVADVANATGKMPNGRTLGVDEKVSVDPNMCKVTFTYPQAVQLNAKKFQGTDSDLQQPFNPQR